MQSYFIGIDIGTQGARVVLLDHKGKQLAAREEVFILTTRQSEAQSPQQWWQSCYYLLQSACKALVTEIDLSCVKAITVTSTSGTIIPLNKNSEPLNEAIMYSDTRSAPQALRCREVAMVSGYKGYTGFNSSAALPKMLWFMEKYPEKMGELNRFIHAADFITGKLSGWYHQKRTRKRTESVSAHNCYGRINRWLRFAGCFGSGKCGQLEYNDRNYAGN